MVSQIHSELVLKLRSFLNLVISQFLKRFRPDEDLVKKASHCKPLSSSNPFVVVKFTYSIRWYLESGRINIAFWC